MLFYSTKPYTKLDKHKLSNNLMISCQCDTELATAMLFLILSHLHDIKKDYMCIRLTGIFYG